MTLIRERETTDSEVRGSNLTDCKSFIIQVLFFTLLISLFELLFVVLSLVLRSEDSICKKTSNMCLKSPLQVFS